MRLRANHPIIFVVAAITCAAASSSSAAGRAGENAGDAMDATARAFSDNNRCSREWGRLVEEWVKSTGGIGRTIAATRQSIASDKRSRFAEATRATWQKSPVETLQVGTWPISTEKYRAVTGDALDAFARYVSSECLSTAWLSPFLWDAVRSQGSSHVMQNRVVDMPLELRGDAASASRWLTYWLLVGS